MKHLRLISVLLVITALALAQVVAGRIATRERKSLPEGDSASYTLPSKMAKITALEFDGMASDFFYLKAIVFLGSAKERKETPNVKPQEWKWFAGMMNAVSDLDPYFADPYYVANAYLPWDAGMVVEADNFLKKGCEYRDWDSLLPFFLGFNYFYFLHDNAKAGDWLMTAARRPGGGAAGYANLAARLAYEGKRTENGVLFLKELIGQTEDEELKARLETRLSAMTDILAIEQAVDSYRRKYRRLPPDIRALVAKGILKQVPDDPYGGEFYLEQDGTVRTTSDLKPVAPAD